MGSLNYWLGRVNRHYDAGCHSMTMFFSSFVLVSYFNFPTNFSLRQLCVQDRAPVQTFSSDTPGPWQYMCEVAFIGKFTDESCEGMCGSSQTPHHKCHVFVER